MERQKREIHVNGILTGERKGGCEGLRMGLGGLTYIHNRSLGRHPMCNASEDVHRVVHSEQRPPQFRIITNDQPRV